MKTRVFWVGLLVWSLVRAVWPAASAMDAQSGWRLKVLSPAAYLPGVPWLVRLEVVDAAGARNRALWDATAVLSVPPNVSLSTNQVRLRNGLGSVLLTVSGGGDFVLSATVEGLSGNKAVQSWVGWPSTKVGGTLPPGNTTWSGIVFVTSDVTVPSTSALTILPDCVVIVEGVASGTTANDFFISGTLNSLGTEDHPVTITSSNPNMRWGQIRHDTSKPSLYQFTSINRGGRATGEGHTGTGPVIRSTNSKLRFEGCNLTDYAEGDRASASFGGPGKVMIANGSDLVIDNCLISRSRMGPEIASTALLCTNTWIMEMPGPDDADGFYVHDQAAGEKVLFVDCVIASGDDDGIDTLGSIVEVERCIIRDWANRLEDAKGISVFNGETHVRHALIVNTTVGIGAKWSSGAPTLVTIDQSTFTGNLTNVWANKKVNAVGPFVDFRITNSILWGGFSVVSDFGQTNFHIGYSTISQTWPGTGNLTSDPLFVDANGHDYRLSSGSASIDAGAPFAALDPDGSRSDVGLFTFLPPEPRLTTPSFLNGNFRFVLDAYPNRNYVVSISTNAVDWTFLHKLFQANQTSLLEDSISPARKAFYKVRLAP